MEIKKKSEKTPNKYERNLKHFIEFKGLNSILEPSETSNNETKSKTNDTSEFENKISVKEKEFQTPLKKETLKKKRKSNTEDSIKDIQVVDESNISETPTKKLKLKKKTEVKNIDQSSKIFTIDRAESGNNEEEEKMEIDLNDSMPKCEESVVKKHKSKKSILEEKQTITQDNNDLKVEKEEISNENIVEKSKTEKNKSEKKMAKEKKMKIKEEKLEGDEKETKNISNPIKNDTCEKKTNHVKRNYVLVENINSSLTTDQLKTYLSENGISFSNALVVPGSYGTANFQRPKDMERLFNVCQGLQYKTNELFIFKSKIENSQEDCVSNLCQTSIHIKNLDLTATKEDISAVLSDLPVENISLNSEKGTAVIDFANSDSAQKCIDLLENRTIGEKIVRASYLVKTRRPEEFILRVLELPADVTKADVRTTFPSASKVKISSKNPDQCLIHFSNRDDLEDVWNRKDEFVVKEVKVSLAQLIERKIGQAVQLKMSYVLNIFNLPFDTTMPEIKQHYPAARFVEMLKNAEGMFVGSAKLMFNDKECCEEALKNSKGLTFKHRKIRAEMKFEETVHKNGR